MNWIDNLVPGYGTVTGQYVAISYDSSDADLTPDVQPLNGTITLTPTVTAGRIDTALAQILSVKVRVFGGQIVDDEDQPGVRIISTDTDLGVQDWAWTARFDFESGLKLKPLPFKVATGETVSLTSGIVPVESAPYQIVKGERGDPGPAWDRTAVPLTADTDMSTLTPALYRAGNGDIATALGLPVPDVSALTVVAMSGSPTNYAALLEQWAYDGAGGTTVWKAWRDSAGVIGPWAQPGGSAPNVDWAAMIAALNAAVQ